MNRILAENRKSLYPIVISPDASEQERYAADELRYYFERMTSAVFTVTTEPADPMVAVGKAAEKAFEICSEGLGEDGLTVRTVGDSIAIVGGKRGVIYGVYELLEQLGCRFFTASCEKIPTQPTLIIPDFDIRQVPVLEFRDHNYYEHAQYSRFAVKSRLNGALVSIKEKFGGHKPYAWFCHSFDTMVPASKYGETHPEYYALLKGGKRVSTPGCSQLCLSNPEVLEVSVESVRAALKARPDARIISITQNDWDDYCHCDACRAIDEEENSPAGIMLRFVNAIAERLEPEFPNVIFDTFAYQYTRTVPKIARPRHNVCVRLCSIEACFAHPLETCDVEWSRIRRPDGTLSSFITDLREWGEICDRMYIWDYTTCFAHYPSPHPNWRVLQPNMRAFIKNNVKGVFEQANGASRGGTDLNELRAYVITKLLWDAETDVERHIREFTDEFYGEAAPYIREYINFLCDTADKEQIHIGFNGNPDTPLFRDEITDRLCDLVQQAKAVVSNDPLRLWRVGKLELSVRWVRLKRHSMLDGINDPDEINRFFADWQAYGLTRIDEWVSREATHKAFVRGLWRGTELYEHWSGDGPEEL